MGFFFLFFLCKCKRELIRQLVRALLFNLVFSHDKRLVLSPPYVPLFN